MNHAYFAALAGLALLSAPAASAQPPAPNVTLRYKFAAGQTLRYLIQRDPYFADPALAIETTDPNAPYRPPRVERLTETVESVGKDGTATIQLTLAPEPGFEEEDSPQPVVTRTVRVTARGEVLTPVSDAADREMREIFVLLPGGVVRGNTHGGLAIIARTGAPSVAERRSPDHDGTLLQITRSTRSDRLVFDTRAGQLVRQRSTLTVTLSLVMTGRGARGADDFGHVIPNVRVVQTLTIERREAASGPP